MFIFSVIAWHMQWPWWVQFGQPHSSMITYGCMKLEFVTGSNKNWGEIADSHRQASRLYTKYGRSQPAPNVLAKDARVLEGVDLGKAIQLYKDACVMPGSVLLKSNSILLNPSPLTIPLINESGTPRVQKDAPISTKVVKASTLKQKQVSPPKIWWHELGSSNSLTILKSGFSVSCSSEDNTDAGYNISLSSEEECNFFQSRWLCPWITHQGFHLFHRNSWEEWANLYLQAEVMKPYNSEVQ